MVVSCGECWLTEVHWSLQGYVSLGGSSVCGPQLWVASRVAEGQLDRLPVFGLHGCRIFKDVEDVVCGESLLEVVQGKVEGVEVDAPWSRKPKGVCLWS